MTGQTATEWKAEGRSALEEYRQLLAKNELTKEETERITYISDKFGEHPLFIRARKANYDARAMHPGLGAPDCSCHINPPCNACIIWTNACEERMDNGEPGCEVVGHDCPIGRGEVRV